MSDKMREEMEQRAVQFSISWGSGGNHAGMMAAFAAKEITAPQATPSRPGNAESLAHEISIAGFLRIEGGRLLTRAEKDRIVSALTPQDGRADIEELANIYLLGRGMAQSSIDQIREYQGETWLKACDLARALAPKGAAA